MIVEHCGAEVIGGSDGVEVAGKVQVDVLHGDNLGVAAARRSALDAEDRAEGRLAQAEQGVLAHGAQGVLQAHGRGRLSLARRSGIDGRDEDELALHRGVRKRVDIHLGLVVSVELELLRLKAGLLCNVGNGEHLRFLRDLDI